MTSVPVSEVDKTTADRARPQREDFPMHSDGKVSPKEEKILRRRWMRTVKGDSEMHTDVSGKLP